MDAVTIEWVSITIISLMFGFSDVSRQLTNFRSGENIIEMVQVISLGLIRRHISRLLFQCFYEYVDRSPSSG